MMPLFSVWFKLESQMRRCCFSERDDLDTLSAAMAYGNVNRGEQTTDNCENSPLQPTDLSCCPSLPTTALHRARRTLQGQIVDQPCDPSLSAERLVNLRWLTVGKTRRGSQSESSSSCKAKRCPESARPALAHSSTTRTVVSASCSSR
jgi:hypothetical protein